MPFPSYCWIISFSSYDPPNLSLSLSLSLPTFFPFSLSPSFTPLSLSICLSLLLCEGQSQAMKAIARWEANHRSKKQSTQAQLGKPVVLTGVPDLDKESLAECGGGAIAGAWARGSLEESRVRGLSQGTVASSWLCCWSSISLQDPLTANM
jgi:hypothetical protein